MFLLKKVIGATFLPLSLCAIVLLVGLILLWFSRKQKLGKVVVSFGTILLLILSFNITTNAILAPLEKKYPPILKTDKLSDVKYSLIDQIRRSSRSVPANLAEAWKKRRYEKAFISKIIDCAGEAGETEGWLDFSKDVGYIDSAKHKKLIKKYDEVNRMLYGMIDKAEKFCK